MDYGPKQPWTAASQQIAQVTFLSHCGAASQIMSKSFPTFGQDCTGLQVRVACTHRTTCNDSSSKNAAFSQSFPRQPTPALL